MTRLRSTQAGGILLLLLAILSSGCAVIRPAVGVRTVTPGQYIAAKRGDILTTRQLSAATLETIRVAGLDEGPCAAPSPACIQAMGEANGLSNERRLLALSELWLQRAMHLRKQSRADPNDARLDAWLEVARHAYAYLFFSERTPGERAFEDRQTQARDYYNLAVQEAVVALFGKELRGKTDFDRLGVLRLSHWTARTDLSGLGPAATLKPPRELVPADSLSFAGLRSVYRRDGFGAELVSVLDDPATEIRREGRDDAAADVPRRQPGRPDTHATAAWSQMPSPSVTVLIRFSGTTLAEVMTRSELVVAAYDPYQVARVDVRGQDVPLAANFTAGYGLWLARAGFSQQSIRSLFGSGRGIDRPHLYLMQPYDPDKRILLMVHGLASSPEAWVNVANELMGDEELRKHFQIWQFYYPTNMPIALNHEAIRQTLNGAMHHFDPDDANRASRRMVIVGHSMGGIIARLMVSSSGDALWNRLVGESVRDTTRLARIRQRVAPILRFEPLPHVERVVFIAAPHRGTDLAGSRLGRWIGHMVRMPLATLQKFADILPDFTPDGAGRRASMPTSIESLDKSDAFVQAAADLPISPRVQYHSIIARRRPTMPLDASDDGLVPYWSSHLEGATSEKIIHAGHSVQETPQAVVELKRILHLDIGERTGNATLALRTETGT